MNGTNINVKEHLEPCISSVESDILVELDSFSLLMKELKTCSLRYIELKYLNNIIFYIYFISNNSRNVSLLATTLFGTYITKILRENYL